MEINAIFAEKPYYLNRYAAVRPDDEIVKNWRDAKVSYNFW